MTERKRPDPLAMIAKIAEEEKRLSETTFLAPIVAGGRVRVRVAGIVYEMKVSTEASGWCILRMTSPGNAELIEPAPLPMVTRYLQLFPRVKLVLVGQFDKDWWAVAHSTADTRIKLSGPVPVRLVSGGTNFDTINTRFDGNAFWFDSVDRRRDPAVARSMRQALEKDEKPDDIHVPGMVPQERLAYRMLWLHNHRDDPTEVDDRTRIGEALRHAGATLDSIRFTGPNQQTAAVRFTVDGREHIVSIRMDDLTIESAGICLSGMDQDFDLASIVGVFRESDYHY